MTDSQGNHLTPDTHTGALGSAHPEAPGKSEEVLAITNVTSEKHKHTTTHTHNAAQKLQDTVASKQSSHTPAQESPMYGSKTIRECNRCGIS